MQATIKVSEEERQIVVDAQDARYGVSLYRGNQVYSIWRGGSWWASRWSDFPADVQETILWHLLAAAWTEE
jgi:hypothetical protein